MIATQIPVLKLGNPCTMSRYKINEIPSGAQLHHTPTGTSLEKCVSKFVLERRTSSPSSYSTNCWNTKVVKLINIYILISLPGIFSRIYCDGSLKGCPRKRH